jgi:hypothetical protein
MGVLDALTLCRVSEAAANGKKADPPKPYVVAQQYINNPHLIQVSCMPHFLLC